MVKKFMGLRGSALNWAVGIIAGCDFLLFGYDQGLMGGLLTMDTFLDAFPVINPDFPNLSTSEKSTRATHQGIAVASYNLGCFFGAIITMFIGNPLGRKRMIILGTSIMIVGSILMASATTLEQFIVGRIITGLGNGGNTSTIPTWQSETSKAHRRGQLGMVEGALISGGIMISYWVDLGFSFVPGSVSWRFPIAFQNAFCIFILSFIVFLPESPRWLVLKKRDAEAREVLAALSNVDINDPTVTADMAAISATVAEMEKGSFRDLFTMDHNRNLHRTILAYVNQVFQQISGINLITYYAPVIYKNLGMAAFMARLLAALNGTEYFIASIPPIWLVERVGRRQLMLFGAAGMAASMAVLAGANSNPSSSACQIVAIVFLFVFNTFFAFGWLGMTWLYPAEIVPLRIRAPANALSTSANWIFNFLVIMITPIAFDTIKYKTYIIFAVINAFIIPITYLFFPETAHRSLEEMDHIFHKVDGWKGCLDVVHQARIEPHWYDRNGVRLINNVHETNRGVDGSEKGGSGGEEDKGHTGHYSVGV